MKHTSLAAKRQRETTIIAAVFLLPVLFFLITFIVYPIIDTFHTSLYKWNGISADKTFVGMQNWKTLFHDQDFRAALTNNLIVMILSVALQIPIGLALATFIEFGGKKMTPFKVIWFIPLLMSSVAIGFLFKYALMTQGGIVSTISKMMGGGNVDLLGNPRTALFTVIGVMAWQFTPFYMVYSMAAYTNISTDVYEAAILDGATKAQYFRRIALPLLKPSLKTAMILSMVGSLKYFDLVFVMTGGGPGTSTELMATYMYKHSFAKYNMGYGSCVAAGMFLIITLISLVTMRVINNKQEE